MAREIETGIAYWAPEHEASAGALMLKGLEQWAWLDFIHGFSVVKKDRQALREPGIQSCLVSPELQGRPVDEVVEIRAFITAMGLEVDCDVRSDLW
jgi:hypothetical protein